MHFKESLMPIQDFRRLPGYQVRLNDYKLSVNSTEPLVKPREDFAQTAAPRYGGISSYGPHLKKSKKGAGKLFYLAPHAPKEYFALEVFLELGIRTPKARIIVEEKYAGTDYSYKQCAVATKGIEGYIPIKAFRHEKQLSDRYDKGLAEFREKYQIDIKNQIVLDLKTGQEYKISGNLFGADVAGTLTADGDFQPDGYNLGLVKVGNRFYAAAIDKEKCSFGGLTYDRLREFSDERIFSDELFKSRLLDQELFTVYKVQQALIPDENKECKFDKIFLNSRVQATAMVVPDFPYKEYCEGIKKSAGSMIDFYKKKLGDNFLVEFENREKLREKLAKKIVAEMKVEGNKQELESIILEDLRGPYYRHLFKKPDISAEDLENPDLVKRIMVDIQNEYALENENALENKDALDIEAEENKDFLDLDELDDNKFFNKEELLDIDDSEFTKVTKSPSMLTTLLRFAGDDREKAIEMLERILKDKEVSKIEGKAAASSSDEIVDKYGSDFDLDIDKDKDFDNEDENIEKKKFRL